MRKIVKINLINFCLLLFLELVFGLFTFDYFSRETIISIFIYTLFSSFVITFITTLFTSRINRIINYIVYFVICFWYSMQFVFKSSMKTFFSLSLFQISDQATGFAGETIKIIMTNLYGIIIFFIPLIVLIVFRKKMDYDISGNKLYLLVYLLLIPLSYCSYRLYLSTEKGKDLSIYDLYYNINNVPLSIQKLGVLSSAGLDFYRSMFGFDEKVKTVNYEEDSSQEVFSYDYNVLELDLDDNDLNQNVKNYIENNPGTMKNKYTGVFEGKNLIFIVAESYNEIAVSEGLTPTLYMLTHNGFIFNNFYVPYYLSTIGGEFQALTGLYPDLSILSAWRNGSNSFPYGLSTVFEEKGYNTYAYHAHSGYFQDRYKYLKALGFDNFKACDMGLNINCNIWPESDIEMMEESYIDYIDSDKPFLAYYMTVSGHMDYNFSGNSMAIKNKELVYSLNYSEEVKAYLATQIELDRALGLLISKLEENGVLDDTVILLTADHYPYALNVDEINELSSYDRDYLFEVNHNPLVIWNNNLNNIEIDKVGMSVDIIPTVYNLFGIDYDSRIFAGNDLLSSSPGLVIFSNGSWITDKGEYNSIYSSFSGTEDNDYVDNINNMVKSRLSFSKAVLSKDGYRYIKEK